MTKWILILLTSTFTIQVLVSQECLGGLGDNLFSEGDFGFGSDVNIQIDPMLAPGYRYIRQGTLFDGEYTITNDMGKWDYLFDAWLPLKDNSNDPFGYMMVVNASFESGLFYEETIGDLCDNTTYQFSADIINVIKRETIGHSEPNVDFLINDEVVFSTGNIIQDEKWNTYSFSFDLEPEQNYVKLSLRNNAPGGIGNDLALDNISLRACGPISEIAVLGDDVVICKEDLPINLEALIESDEGLERLYQWEFSNDSINWTIISGEDQSQLIFSDLVEEQFSYFRFSTAASIGSFDNQKCRFYSSVLSVFLQQKEFVRFDTICGGTSLAFDNTELINPGLYIDTLNSRYGCDSIIILNLDTVKRELLTASLESVDPLCYQEPTGLISATNVQGGFPPYSLYIDNVEYEGLRADNLMEGAYNVLLQDRFNCFLQQTVSLIDPPMFNIDIGSDINILLGEDINIDVLTNFEIASIEWSDPFSEYDNILSFVHLPTASAELQARAISIDGCVSIDTLKIDINTDVSIYIPNIFSPNGDNNNDIYSISTFGQSLGGIHFFNIYDRWGNLIWEYTDSITSWDGKDKNMGDVAEGIYIYVLEAYLINNDIIKSSGSITVLR